MWVSIGNALQPALGAASQIKAIKVPPAPIVLPKGLQLRPETTLPQVDEALKKLDAAKDAWVAVGAAERAKLLRECLRRLLQVQYDLARDAVELSKGSYGQGIGEELSALTPVVLGLKEYAKTLEAGGCPAPVKLYTRPSGQHVAQVFPKDVVGVLFSGFKAEVWIQKGKPPTQGVLYRAKAAGQSTPGSVGLVLGAGNQINTVFLDILHKLLVDDAVVLAKISPINEYAGPHVEKILAPFVEQGFLKLVYGGRTVGEHLVNHPLVHSIHLTGSRDTFNSIVWGSPTAELLLVAVAAQRVGQPKLPKVVTAELGNITPHIVVPGKWTDADMEYQAETIVTELAHNASHNCIALEVLVTDRSWPQREQFLDAIRAVLRRTPQRVAYYPRSDERFDRFRQLFPQAEELGVPTCEADQIATRPYMMVTGLSIDEAQVSEENWCTAFQEVALSGTGGDPAAFMCSATDFVNKRCSGTLECSITIDPATQAAHQEAFDTMIEELRYGTISVNVPTVVGYALTALPWGAYPGNLLDDIGSGVGFVQNTFMFDFPEKGVVYGPWRYNPKPFWFTGNTNTTATTTAAHNFLAYSHQLFWALHYVNQAALAAVRG